MIDYLTVALVTFWALILGFAVGYNVAVIDMKAGRK